MGRMTIKPTCKVLGYSLLHLFARTAHSFACSALLAALIRSVARSLTRSRAHGKDVIQGYSSELIKSVKLLWLVCEAQG